MTDLIKIGAILKLRIKELNFTQTEFAEKAGIGVSTLKSIFPDNCHIQLNFLINFQNC